jgi:hypothetical protein
MACIPGVNFLIFEYKLNEQKGLNEKQSLNEIQSWAIPDDWKKEDISLIKGNLYYREKKINQNSFWCTLTDTDTTLINTIIISDCEVLQYDYDIYAPFADGDMTDEEIQEWVKANIATI